jgi:hypothetical protein
MIYLRLIIRIAAIVFIFICASVAWMILAFTVSSRTTSAGAGLHGRVVSVWGAPHEQKPPSAGYNEAIQRYFPRQMPVTKSEVRLPF